MQEFKIKVDPSGKVRRSGVLHSSGMNRKQRRDYVRANFVKGTKLKKPHKAISRTIRNQGWRAFPWLDKLKKKYNP